MSRKRKKTFSYGQEKKRKPSNWSTHGDRLLYVHHPFARGIVKKDINGEHYHKLTQLNCIWTEVLQIINLNLYLYYTLNNLFPIKYIMILFEYFH